MKKVFVFLSTIATVVLMAACNKTPNPETPENGTEPTELDWSYFRGSAYLGDIASYGEELMEAIEEFFPLEADMAGAQVVFAGESDIKAKSPSLLKAIANDAFIVFPSYEGVEEDFAALGVTLDVPHVADNSYEPLLYCYNGYGQGFTYAMFGQTEFEEPEELDEYQGDWDALIAANKDLGPDPEEDYEGYEWDYYEILLSGLAEWLEDELTEQAQTKSAYATNMGGEIESLAKRYTYSYGVNLNKAIDKDFYMNKSTIINVDIRVYPVYKQAANGESSAGDYYIVVSKVIPYNQRMWEPKVFPYRWACRCRTYSYWFEEMNVATSLVQNNGADIEGLNYFDDPFPENKNESISHSKTKSFNIGGSLNGGIGDVAGTTLGGGMTIGGGWSTTTSYTLSTIDFTVDSSSPTVRYRYYTNEENVTLEDEWDDWGKINQNWPSSARNEFRANTRWVWHVPSVKDNDKTTFTLKQKLDITYASWYHWRGASHYKDNKKTYKTSFSEVSWKLGAPNRVPWGIIALKNASTYEMSHVTVYDSNNKKVDALSTSFSKNELAKISLPVGTYSIHFDLKDGNSQRTYASYVYSGIEVHAGADEKSATVEISTIDAVKQ